MSETNSVENGSYRMPTTNTINHVMKLAIVEDKPIMMDYWTASIEKKALRAVRLLETIGNEIIRK